MRCYRCNGYGTIKGQMCNYCRGSGVIIPTNEEYIKNSGTKQLVDTLYNLLTKKEKVKIDKDCIRNWLKERRVDD